MFTIVSWDVGLSKWKGCLIFGKKMLSVVYSRLCHPRYRCKVIKPSCFNKIWSCTIRKKGVRPWWEISSRCFQRKMTLNIETDIYSTISFHTWSVCRDYGDISQANCFFHSIYLKSLRPQSENNIQLPEETFQVKRFNFLNWISLF